MLVVLSPAKRLRMPQEELSCTEPEFLAEAGELVEDLRHRTPRQLSSLMGISANLAQLNAERYQNWQPAGVAPDAGAALLMFQGDVYQGLAAGEFNAAERKFAQRHLRILSGLYGVLRPLDRIQPYRLEMGTSLANRRGADLYDFWKKSVSAVLRRDLGRSGRVLVNLASQEYARVLDRDALDAEIIEPSFRDLRKGRYRVISFFAKKARGMMSAYIVRNRLREPASLREFCGGGYRYNEQLSDGASWVFTREAPA